MVPHSNPRTRTSSLDRASTIVVLIGGLIFAGFLYRQGSPYAGGADSSGYLNSAELMSHGHFFGPVRAPAGYGHASFSRGAFEPLGFRVDPQIPRMAPTYPLGLPLHLMAAAAIGGWDRAALIVSVFAALAGGAILWSLARLLQFSPAWAAVAVIWLWLCPQYVFCALQPMSDSLALLWSLVALYTAMRSREAAWWCVACGAALAMAILVRPTNSLLVIPVLIAVGPRLRPLLWLVSGGIPGAVFLGFYNHHVYGAILTTGYGDVGAAFSRHNVPHNVQHILGWSWRLLTPLIGTVMALPFLARKWTKEAVVLSVWAGLLIGFYSFYYHTGETWWYLRFILPAFPILILGAIAGAQEIMSRAKFAPTIGLAAVLVVLLPWETKFNRELHSGAIQGEEMTYRQSADWVRHNLPVQSAIFCMQVSGALYFYTDFLLVRWDTIEPGSIAPLLGVLRDQHRPVYAVLYEFEAKGALARIGGEWKKITTVGAATVWQRESP